MDAYLKTIRSVLCLLAGIFAVKHHCMLNMLESDEVLSQNEIKRAVYSHATFAHHPLPLLVTHGNHLWVNITISFH